MEFLIVVAFLLFLVLAIVIARYTYLKQQRRQAELAGLAAELGWQFAPSKDSSHSDRYPQFKIFQKGHTRYAHNTIWGSIAVNGRDWPIQMGDYHYRETTSNGKNSSTHTYRFSYAIFETPFASLPDLSIRKEGFFDKLAGFVGFDDIDFESTEFSDRFHVQSSDKKFAYNVVDPRMMEFLLTTESPIITLSGLCCCLHESNRRWSPQRFRSLLGWSTKFFEHWPNHVVSTLTAK